MKIDHVRAFCQLASDQNYRIAAANLFITQSALTKKIKQLEESIDLLLFTRGRNGAELTHAGKSLLPDATKMLNQFDNFQRLAVNTSEGTEGKLNIGFGISTYFHAPKYVAEFKRHYPNVQLTLNDSPSSYQRQTLLTGDLQISFNRLQDIAPPLQGIKLLSDSLVVAVHEDDDIDMAHLWASLSNLDYLQLNPARGLGLNQQIISLLNEESQTFKAVQEADDILTLLALVSARLGFTIIPESAQAICQPNIKLIKIDNVHANWDIGVIWNDDIEDTIRSNFIDLVKKLPSRQLKTSI